MDSSVSDKEKDSLSSLPPLSTIAYHPQLGYLFEGHHSLNEQAQFVKALNSSQSSRHSSSVDLQSGKIAGQPLDLDNNVCQEMQSNYVAEDQGYRGLFNSDSLESLEFQGPAGIEVTQLEGFDSFNGDDFDMRPWLHFRMVDVNQEQQSATMEYNSGSGDLSGHGTHEPTLPSNEPLIANEEEQVETGAGEATIIERQGSPTPPSPITRRNRDPQVHDQEGWRWRKQGQKTKKDGTIRCYYRCCEREQGCPASLLIDKDVNPSTGECMKYTWITRKAHNHERPNRIHRVFMDV